MEVLPESGVNGPEQRVIELERKVVSLREQSEVAQALLGLSAALGTTRTVDETLELAVRAAVPAMGADRAVALKLTEEGAPTVAAAHGFTSEDIARLRDGRRGDLMAVPMRRALSSREALLLAGDAAAEPSAGTAPYASGLVVVPLTRWGDDLGVLQIEYLEPPRFTSREATLAEGIAAELATALANARQYSLFQGLRRFGLRIGRRLQLGPLIEHIAGGVVELLDADAAAVYFSDPSESSLVLAGGEGMPAGVSGSPLQIDLAAAPWTRLARGQSLTADDLRGASELGGAGDLRVIASPIPHAREGTIGAVLAFFAGAPGPSPDDSEALGVAASQAGVAIKNARRYERQRRMVRHLQDGLLKTDIPVMDGCEIGTVYQPASGTATVGGDFYDVFELTDGRYGFVVGDVSGKGAEAAAQTAMAKYMLRAYATSDPSPASVLFHLNNGLVGSMGEERFTTLVYGLFDPAERRCWLASAGHPGPLVHRHLTREVERVEVPGGILGAFEDQDYKQEIVDFLPGDILLAYTDGVLEVRSHDELYGADRLRHSLSELPPDLAAADIARRVFEAAERFGTISDDTVVFALKCFREQ